MSTVVVALGSSMVDAGRAWGEAIKRLLQTHKLSLKGAAVRGGYTVSRTYISEWMDGKIPQYRTAVEFLSHFPKDEAMECLKAAGYPVPEDWQKRLEGPVTILANRLGAVEYLSESDEQWLVCTATKELEEALRNKLEEKNIPRDVSDAVVSHVNKKVEEAFREALREGLTKALEQKRFNEMLKQKVAEGIGNAFREGLITEEAIRKMFKPQKKPRREK